MVKNTKSNVVTKKIGKNSKVTISDKKTSVSTNNKYGTANIDSNGNVSINIKTPIKGLTFKKSVKLFK